MQPEIMYAGVYLEINILCMITLSYVLIADMRRYDKSTETILFDKALANTIIVLLLDSVWMAIEHFGSTGMRPLNIAANAGFLFWCVLVSYQWVMYLEYKILGNVSLKRKIELILYLPLAAMAIITFASIFTGWMFTVDEANVYHRGAFYLLQPIVSYAYLVGFAIHAFICLIRANNEQDRERFRTLLSFFVLPFFGGIASVFFFGMPLIWPAVTLSALLVYQNFQNFQISTDGLTGLNNRRKFDVYFRTVMESVQTQGTTYLMLIDVDKFKNINDRFGHVEGDDALVCVADILRKICGRARDAFLARYGGDEFVMVVRNADEAVIKNLVETLDEAIESENEASSRPYELSLSVGYAPCPQEESGEMGAVIAKADHMLYKVKRKRHEI